MTSTNRGRISFFCVDDCHTRAVLGPSHRETRSTGSRLATGHNHKTQDAAANKKQLANDRDRLPSELEHIPRSQHIPPQFIYSCETVAKMPMNKFRGQYFYLSNFYPCKDGVEFDGDASPTIIRARLHDIVPRSQDRAASEWIIHNRAAARYQKIVEGTSDKFLGRPTTKPLNLGNILMWLRQESMAAHNYQRTIGRCNLGWRRSRSRSWKCWGRSSISRRLS